MDHDGPEDLLDDGEFDTLPPGTLAALEQRTATPHSAALQQQVDAEEVPDADSDYGLDDEDVIDLDAQPSGPTVIQHIQPLIQPRTLDEATQRELWRQQRHGGTGMSRSTSGPVEQPLSILERSREPATAQSQTTDVVALRTRVAELEQIQAALRKASDDARFAAVAKAGEIAIVRANQDKVAKEYERKLSVLQKLHSEETGKYRAELAAARKDREKMETTNRFLEHDLIQEAERARGSRKTLKDGHGNANRVEQASPATTPKKSKTLPFRDGFNDDEVAMTSPSRKKDRSKPSTPKGGAKRKRNQLAAESPSRPLSFTEPQPDVDGDSGDFQIDDTDEVQNAGPIHINLHIRKHDESEDEHFAFIQIVLGQRTRDGRRRAVELLTTFATPSDPQTPLSSMVYDACNYSLDQPSIVDFRKGFCVTIAKIWSRCLADKYYKPLRTIVDMLSEILLLSPLDLTASVLTTIVPLCLATADVVALARAKASKAPALNKPPNLELCEELSPQDSLELLQQIATDCDTRGGERKAFWSAMEHSFLLLLLHKAQPLLQITLMLDLLATSVLEDSFGAIVMTARESNEESSIAQRQAKHEAEIIDRLTILLFDVPEEPKNAVAITAASGTRQEADPARDENGPTTKNVLKLRLSVLDLLKNLCFTRHGGHVLGTHRRAMGRLVRLLHENIVMMYEYFPATHSLTTAIINQTVALLAHLTSEHADVVDMRSRLAVEPSGAYKHLVALGRVAFAEGASKIEEGLTQETQDLAHRMLDETLSPEEGEAVMNVFSSAR